MQTSRHVEQPDAHVLAVSSTATWVVDVAARHARNSGVEVRIILPRGPGVATAVRDAARAAQVTVFTTISSDHVTAVFGAACERPQPGTAGMPRQ
jgi:hypothetical protein